jgi:predicted NAD/FAD-binding protein
MMAFPAATLVRFFHNHGFLGMNTQHQWYTVKGGSREYVQRLIAPFANRIRLQAPVRRITRSVDGVMVAFTESSGEAGRMRFDQVLIAAHSDEALRMLGDPAPQEVEALKSIAYQPNTAYIHSDPSVMPKTRRAWASWNYRIDRSGPDIAAVVHYWMNSLQGVSKKRDYFVSLVPEGTPPPKLDDRLVHKVIAYSHPLFSHQAVDAQTAVKTLPERLPHLQTFFAGAYLGYGFHEDGIRAGLQAAQAIERQWSL